ncbi:hypothetical protein [Bdellovibrio sp. HCB209]|uniref:hypothetical protein n=1 Tax=Bdellovibrio sp. HCB209 TaxID=3394354 RepID=UPI0039B4A78E
MKVLNATIALASVIAFSTANAAESAQMQQPTDASVNSHSVQQHTEVQKDSKGAIKRKKSTVEEQNLQQQQQAVPSTQQPAAGQ